MSQRPPLQVYLTVDTELWPNLPGWPSCGLPAEKDNFDDEVAADVHGLSTRGGFGLPYQIGVFNRFKLKATYFVESLFASRGAIHTLAHIVDLVQGGGHEVQLHLHTEWLGELSDPSLPSQATQYLCELTLEQQSALVRKGLDNLTRAGAAPIHAFRAGSYGANLDTLRALARNGIGIDSSYNPSYLVGDWNGLAIAGPQLIEGVWEFPIAAFRDFPGHLRHAQLCAISFAEMRHALERAWYAGWHAFVIVLHSFELVRRHGPHRLPTPEQQVIRRFEQLCAFLDAERGRFHTTQFSRFSAAAAPPPARHTPPRSHLPRTADRYVQQLWSRIR